MEVIHTQSLPTVLPIPGKPLGRNIEHDVRSRAYGISAPIEAPVTVYWSRRAPVFTQAIGACTGMSMAGVIGTDSRGRTGLASANENLAVDIYTLATRLDRIQGVYPPYDTGSTGLAACKAARKLGYITGYTHAFGLDDALRALQNGPCLVGISWLTDCDDPDTEGVIRYKGYQRGGHEIMMSGFDVTTGLVEFINSWGIGWGKAGHFYMSAEDLGIALSQGGDVTQPIFA